jgi:hypothetical protein
VCDTLPRQRVTTRDIGWDMPIPWRVILTHGPAIVSAAQSLFANQSKRANERQQGLDARLDQLEKASVESARLLQELAQQVQALTLAEQDLQKRVLLAVTVGAVGVLVGIAAAFVAFLR